jgi:uncharacterized membrane protein YdjX (TVP38/TMEM64 family)
MFFRDMAASCWQNRRTDTTGHRVVDPLRHRPSTILRIALVVVLAAGIVASLAWLRTAHPELRMQTLKDLIGTSAWAPVLFILVSIVASLAFVPRTILAAAAGLLFGLWWGLLWAVIGSITGSVAGFLLARYLSVGLVDESRWPRFAPLLRAAERGGWRTVAVIRLIPVLPNTPVNYAFGVTGLSLSSYTIGTAVGQLPMTYVWTQLGTSGNYALSGGQWVMPTLLSLALLVVSMILPRLPVVRRSLRHGVE